MYSHRCVFLYLRTYTLYIEVEREKETETLQKLVTVLSWLGISLCIFLYVMQRGIERERVGERDILVGIVNVLSSLCVSVCKLVYVMQRGIERERELVATRNYICTFMVLFFSMYISVRYVEMYLEGKRCYQE